MRKNIRRLVILDPVRGPPFPFSLWLAPPVIGVPTLGIVV
jgi:hypothetical protein